VVYIPKIAANIDRRTASKILGVTVRTIDRYIRRGKLFANQEGNRIWLDRNEVINLPRQIPIREKTSIDTTTSKRLSTVFQKEHEADFYRDLYEEAKRALSEYQQKLEQSNYRIGQLESQIIHPIPSKSFEGRDDFFSIEMLKKDLQEREKEITLLKELVKRERTSRIIFAVLTYILLILQPVFWYLLR